MPPPMIGTWSVEVLAARPFSKSERCQRMVTRAPLAGAVAFTIVMLAPDRSSSVLAMKRPRPSPDPNSPFARRLAL